MMRYVSLVGRERRIERNRCKNKVQQAITIFKPDCTLINIVCEFKVHCSKGSFCNLVPRAISLETSIRIEKSQGLIGQEGFLSYAYISVIEDGYHSYLGRNALSGTFSELSSRPSNHISLSIFGLGAPRAV